VKSLSIPFGQILNRTDKALASMKATTFALAVFVVLTVVFASLTVNEYSQSSSLGSIISSMGSAGASTTTSCTATGGIGCPHFLTKNWTISVSYTGPWGVTYPGWLGDQTSGQPIVSGSFYGNNTVSKTFNVSGTTDFGITVCAEAQKLDSSTSTLTVSILPTNVTNQTSAAYGTTKTCVADLIA
jgi:hypothetical protein